MTTTTTSSIASREASSGVTTRVHVMSLFGRRGTTGSERLWEYSLRMRVVLEPVDGTVVIIIRQLKKLASQLLNVHFVV